MTASDILHGLSPQQDETTELRIWLDLPDGYLPLPVRGSALALVEAEKTLRELCPPERLDLLYATLGTFATLLDELDQRNAVYCGLGWHASPTDGLPVSSTLVVSLQYMKQERNPRLVLGDLVRAAADAGDEAQADLVDLANGPSLFFESVRGLRRPSPPGQLGDPGFADVYQLQAVVPNEKGDWIAVLEFSTPQVEYGMLYREMMVLAANSVSFTPPPGAAEQGAPTRSIHQLLEGGLT
jgi:hypothetical protein